MDEFSKQLCPGNQPIRGKLFCVNSKKPKPNRPDNSAFKQQRLPSWQPVVDAKAVMPIMFVLSLGCLLAGSFIIIEANNVIKLETDYSNCVPKTFFAAEQAQLQKDDIAEFK